MAQRDKQKMLLSMDSMVSKLPDKGKSIEARVGVLDGEIASAKAELRARHGAGVPASEASKSAAMAALDSHIAETAPAIANKSAVKDSAKYKPELVKDDDEAVEDLNADGVAEAMSDDDEGEDEVVEEVDITAGPESIAGTDDGDGDGDEEPTPSSPAPAAPVTDGEMADLHLDLVWIWRGPIRTAPIRTTRSRRLRAPLPIRRRWTTCRRCSGVWACET